MHGVELTPSTEFSLLWLIPALPLLGAAINGMFGLKLMRRFGPKANHTIAIILPSISFLIAVTGFIKLLGLEEGARALHNNLFPFIHVGLFDADLAFWLDPLSATMTLVITFIGTLIHVYSIGYMAGDESYWRFFAYLNLFMAAMLTLVLGDNFMVMFIGWEGVGLCSYLLISFWYKTKANAVAGNKAFIVNRVGDFGFIIGLALLFWGLAGYHSGSMFVGTGPDGAPALATDGYRTAYYGNQRIADLERAELCGQYGGCELQRIDGTTSPIPASSLPLAQRFRMPRQAPPTSLRFDAVRARVQQDVLLWAEESGTAKTFMGIPIVVLICLLLFLGATGKSAQIPLYVWLPDAMAGPTPVSALIHAATMVTAGVYMVARCSFLFSLSPTAMTVVAVVGVITALFAATIGLFQYDIKKVLAYSTVSQLGYMFIGVGVGAYWAGIYHLVTHAAFKACLFLGSGSVILGCHHEQDMRKMGGLKKYMPSTERTYFFSCIAITTAPVFLISNGFFSKDEILWKAFDAGHLLIPGWIIWVVGFVGAGLTAFYMWRSYYMTFTGEYRGGQDDHHGDDAHGHHGGTPHESPKTMTYVLWTLVGLSFATIILGFWPLLGGMAHIHALQEPLFERWLHPVVGAATASLTWLSATTDMHAAELGLAAASVVISLGGWYVARTLYKDAKSEIPARLLASTSPVLRGTHQLIYNKYYVDEIYGAAFVRGLGIKGSQALSWFDKNVIDGMVNLAGFLGRLVAAIDGLIDSLIVDGAVNLMAQTIKAIGRRVRLTQTGQIQTYLAGAIVGALALVVVNYYLFTFF